MSTDTPYTAGLRHGLSVAAVVLVLDQATKWWILTVVMNPPRMIPVLPFFNLVLGWNRGISFGLFDSYSAINLWLLPVVAGVIIIALLVWLGRVDNRVSAIAIGLIIGGAVGNVVDRLHQNGAVTDFLDFHVAGFHWPAFNVADAGITIGAVALIVDSLFVHPDRGKNGAAKDTDSDK